MHLTRPKSSKGRSRAAVSSSSSSSSQRSPVSPPDSPGRSRPDRALRSRSQPVMWPPPSSGSSAGSSSGSSSSSSGPLSREEEVMQLLQHAPAAPPQSLNKYKVLPSIERQRCEETTTGLGEDMSKLSLSHHHHHHHHHLHHHGAMLLQEELDLCPAQTSSSSSSEGGDSGPPLRIWPKPPGPEPEPGPGPGPGPEPGPGPGPGPEPAPAPSSSLLLLAIRAPCGRRFQQHFEPTDTLLTVRASAESQFGSSYGDASSVETMDVPRRSFTDMDRTLAQCGILNRSVLCISQTVVDQED